MQLLEKHSIDLYCRAKLPETIQRFHLFQLIFLHLFQGLFQMLSTLKIQIAEQLYIPNLDAFQTGPSEILDQQGI